MRILVISINFGRLGVASSNHIDDRVLELLDRGLKVDIVTQDDPNIQFQNTTENISLFRICAATSLFTLIKNLEFMRIINRQLYKVTSRLGYRDLTSIWEWEQAAYGFIVRNLDIEAYDLVYSTGGPAVAHLVAYDLAKRNGLKWVAEIQDPIIYEELLADPRLTNREKRKLQRVEHALKSSDVLICLTEECRRYYQKKLDKQSVYCLYPGSNIRRWVSEPLKKNIRLKKGKKLRVFHAGTLAGTRNIQPFVDAVVQLGLQEQIELVLAGIIFPDVSCIVAKYPNFIRSVGKLSRKDTAKHISESDVCLVIQHLSSISQLTIPSKFYDYSALGATILFLGYNNQEMQANSERFNFYYADQSSIEQVMSALELLMLVKKQSKPRKVAVPICIRDSTDRFIEICKESLGHRSIPL
jgi:hypothetical protein